MTETDYARAFERSKIAPPDLHHASHLQVAWAYLSESSSVEEAAAKMRNALQKFVASVGQADKYHETITQFWVRRLAREQDLHSGQSFDYVVVREPRLLDKNYPLSYYSPQRLASEEARTSWLEPDLRPLP